jgi:serine/threonine-protein kinase
MALSSAPAFTGVGPYQVVRYMGHGPVAAAYLCHNANASDGLYVMSIVHDDLSVHRWLIEQLLIEVADCARVQHVNVESIVEFGTVEQHGYVVTRYIDGCALSRLLMLSGGELPLRIGLALVGDVLRGLHAAHSLKDARERPIVHSGVVPACILVGRDGIARVAEFGIARVQMRTTQTMPGVRSDRFAHLSPEQIAQSGEVDPRADIFAVGTILWSLATAESLFGVGDSVATMHRVLHHQPAGPSSTGRRPPAWLDPICLRALQKDPAQRYASAEEMANELHARATSHKTWASRSEIAEWVENALTNADAILPPDVPPPAPPGLSFQRVGGSDALRMTATGPRTTDTGVGTQRKAAAVIIIVAAMVIAVGGAVLLIGNRHLTLRFATAPQISSAIVLSPPPPSSPPSAAPSTEVAPEATAEGHAASEQQNQVSSSTAALDAKAQPAVHPPAPATHAKLAPPTSKTAMAAAPSAPAASIPAVASASAAPGTPSVEPPPKPFFPPVENNPYLRRSH